MRCFPFLVAILLVAGCGTINRAKAPWTVITTEGPWASAGQQASLETRSYWASPMASAMTSEERFITTGGRALDARRTAARTVDFFEKKGVLQTWPKTNAYINGRAAVLAPYRFQVVSIFPLIVVLTEHDYGPVENRATSDLVGKRSAEKLGDDRMMNHIAIGTIIPDADKLFWCSPDLNVSISPVPTDSNGDFMIVHPEIMLVGRKSNARIIFERKK